MTKFSRNARNLPYILRVEFTHDNNTLFLERFQKSYIKFTIMYENKSIFITRRDSLFFWLIHTNDSILCNYIYSSKDYYLIYYLAIFSICFLHFHWRNNFVLLFLSFGTSIIHGLTSNFSLLLQSRKWIIGKCRLRRFSRGVDRLAWHTSVSQQKIKKKRRIG